MKKRFLALLALLIAFVSLIAVVTSLSAAKGGIERLILERANNRLSIIIWGFDTSISTTRSCP
jgi:hypothetical protein